jgi:diguanylate cyclase (GGDEF)-like protein
MIGPGNNFLAEAPGAVEAPAVLLIEDSVALSTLLTAKIEQETGARVIRCANMAQARKQIARHRFALALTGLNLPDAPQGEILRLLANCRIPTIVFTGTFDAEARQHYAEMKIIDYIVKDGVQTIDTVLKTVNRILTNGAFTVLVVDDGRTARSGLVEILQRQNFRVLEAYSGVDALKVLAADDQVELVITDYIMPDMDGYELTRRIRELRSSEELRIIGVSSSSDRLLSASFLKAGASDFIYRPFVPEELQCRIDNNIETLKQLKRLRRLAERDHLTGLANRRYFFEKMRAISTTTFNGSIAVLDIDFFKSVNDTFGHDAGDRVLMKLADLIAEFCSSTKHIPARIGGEEFAIYLRDTNALQAHSLCEHLLAEVRAMVVPTSSQDVSITISIGVVEMEAGEPFENHLNAADQLLYMAKANGRNRVYSNLTILEAMQPAAA